MPTITAPTGNGPGPLRKHQQREADLVQVSEWYLRGLTQLAMLERLARLRPYRISRGTISRDIALLHQRWLAAQVHNMDLAKTKELAKVDHLEAVYWDAWERSTKERKITGTKQSKGGAMGDRAEATIRTEERLGELAALAGVQWCIERRCKLLGLDAPTRLEGEFSHMVREYVGIDVNLV